MKTVLSIRRSALLLAAATLTALCAASAASAQAAASPNPVVLAPQAGASLAPSGPRLKVKSGPPAFDLTGVWWVTQPEGAAGFKPDPPLKPDAQKVLDEVNRLRGEGLNARDKTGNCLPAGMPLIMTRVYPTQIMQQPKLITIIYEYENSVRWIFMDGRDHPQGDDLIPSYYGHSVGWWEGDTLVVDTVGMNTEPDIQPGVPHTDKLHIVERIKLTPEGFVDEMTMTDPNIFTKPWVTAKRYRKSDADLQEFVCLQENNHYASGEDGILRSVDTPVKK